MSQINVDRKESESEEKKGSQPPSRQDSQQSLESTSSSFEKIEQDEADHNLYMNATLPPIVLLGNPLIDNPVDPDPRTHPIPAHQEAYYTPEVARTAIGNLIIFSILMFVAPLGSMYLSYQYIFIDYFELNSSEATLDAGLVGIGTVFMIMAGFCYVAYREEVEAEKEKLAKEKPVAPEENKKDK